jgi:oligopeptide/dipeptide ABC transporter ATP-binding protein
MTEGFLLSLDGLQVDLRVRSGRRRVINGVSLTVQPGESVGLVGESGSGKSMTAKSIMRLLPRGALIRGDILFDGDSVPSMTSSTLRAMRAHGVAMIHQDPRATVNPLRTIGDYLTEAAIRVDGTTRRDAEAAAIQLLGEVGISDAGRRLRQYPHQLSGGLLQRVMIASAVLARPKLLLADEPTTALDVTTQEEVMAVLDEARRDRKLGMIFITHNLDLAVAVTDRIAVMYAGVLVEVLGSAALHRTARHPYTVGLLGARPRTDRLETLRTIPGRPVAAYEVGDGCVFASRCRFVEDRCRTERPILRDIGGSNVACHRAEEIEPELVADRRASA